MHSHEPSGGLPPPPIRPSGHSDMHAHKPCGRLPLLLTRLAVAFPAVGHHRRKAITNLYCLVTEAHRCEKFALSFYAVSPAETLTHDLLIASKLLYRQCHYVTFNPTVGCYYFPPG